MVVDREDVAEELESGVSGSVPGVIAEDLPLAEPAEPEAAVEPETPDGRPARGARAPRGPARPRPVALDQVCAAAVDLARAAAVEEADGVDGLVGEHLGTEAEADRVVLHRFACLLPGYPGWAWTVVVTRAARMKVPTVADVVLLPGADAVLAPPWVPWSERLRPGDVGVGDLLPTAADDPRLVLRAFAGDDETADEVTGDETAPGDEPLTETGLGRPRVLSRLGREEAADRWYAGEPGPRTQIAKAAPATCATCGFHVRLGGPLGRLFGACANELAPDDAKVTSVDHGCGAHSEALVAPPESPASLPD